MDTLERLVGEGRERQGRGFEETEVEEQRSRDIACLDLVEKFGRNYIKKLTTFTEEEVDEILAACEETSRPTGPGRGYKDIKCRVVIYLTWPTSGWTIRGLADLFRMTPPSVQRTINCVMSGLAHSLERERLPQSREEIERQGSSRTLLSRGSCRCDFDPSPETKSS